MKDLILIITGVPIKVNRIVCQESNANYKTLTKINHIVITQQNDVNQSTSALWASANAKKPGLFLTLCVRVIDLSRVGQRIVMPSATVRWTVAGIKKPPTFVGGLVFALPIFPGSRPPSIVGVHELNFCVRDGNRWTLMTINTNSLDGF